MGSMAIHYGVIALATGLVCLIAGFFWGRTDLRSKVEQAVEREHVALDAREFAMRQQLDEVIAEIARLRPLAEEHGRLQERLKQEQSRYKQMKSEFDAISGVAVTEDKATEELLAQEHEVESTDEVIQKLLKSLEDNLQQPEQLQPPQPLAVPPEPQAKVESVPPAPAIRQPEAPPAPPKAVPVSVAQPKPSIPIEKPPVRVPEPAVPAAKVQNIPVRAPKPAQPASGQVDEWQEFARSLADLTRRKS